MFTRDGAGIYQFSRTHFERGYSLLNPNTHGDKLQPHYLQITEYQKTMSTNLHLIHLFFSFIFHSAGVTVYPDTTVYPVTDAGSSCSIVSLDHVTSARTDDSLTFTWSVDDHFTSGISDCDVIQHCVREESNFTFSECVYSSNQTSGVVIFRELTPGTTYIVTMVTIDTANSENITISANTLPAKAPGVSVVAKTHTVLTVSWDEIPGQFDFVEITCFGNIHAQNDSVTIAKADPQITSVDCTGLSPDTLYTVVVTTVNSGDKVSSHPILIYTGETQDPQVDPLFGPLSGGTNLTITAHITVAVENVTLGENIKCYILNRTLTQVMAMTPPARGALQDVPLMVRVEFTDGTSLVTNQYFTYRGDPVIESIHPLETLSVGGTSLTISGASLNAVAYPELTVSMVIRETVFQDKNVSSVTETTTLYSGECDIVSEQQLTCITPEMGVPGDNSSSCLGKIHQFSKSPGLRECTEVNVTFYLGMTLDGVLEYANISENENLTEYGVIKVYQPPEFQVDQKYRFKRKRHLDIKGSGLTRGTSPSDYLVTIGNGECAILDISENVLHCNPPQKVPMDKLSFQTENFDIEVNVGTNLKVHVGKISYKSHLPIYTACAVVVALVIIIVPTAVCVAKNNKKKKYKPRSGSADELVIDLPPVQIEDLGKSLTQKVAGFGQQHITLDYRHAT